MARRALRHWEHDGPCRWPHNSAIEADRDPALFRTLFVCDEGELATVSERVVRALRGAEAWRVVAVAERPVAESEQALAERLLGGPRAPA